MGFHRQVPVSWWNLPIWIVASTLLGAGGVLAFLRPDRGWLALASVLLLAVTLRLRLRAITRCSMPPHTPTGASAHPSDR